MKRNKQAVSLITLVITIIIIIIIAGAIILSLANTNIFDKAKEAVDKYNKNQQQTIDGLEWLEWYENVSQITVEGVPIPRGFALSPYKGERTKNEGLVIYALTPGEIKKGVNDITKIDENYQESLENRNQFVWVPVNDFEKDFVRTDFFGGTFSEELGVKGKYWEVVLDENNMPSQDVETHNIVQYISPETLKEVTAMYASVKKYGGFYIAKYEVGNSTVYNDSQWGYIASRGDVSAGTNKKLSVSMGKYPYNDVTFSNATSLARGFYPSDENVYGVVSTLTYGVQWDRTINWWKELDLLDGKEDLKLNTGVYSTTKIKKNELNINAKYAVCEDDASTVTCNLKNGWFDAVEKTETGDWLFTTGAYMRANIYNVYDMAGNLSEWTMEGYKDTSGNVCRVRRGNHAFSGALGAEYRYFYKQYQSGVTMRFPTSSLYQIIINLNNKHAINVKVSAKYITLLECLKHFDRAFFIIIYIFLSLFVVRFLLQNGHLKYII